MTQAGKRTAAGVVRSTGCVATEPAASTIEVHNSEPGQRPASLARNGGCSRGDGGTAMRDSSYECRKAMGERDELRALVREILAVMDNAERTPEEMLLMERANNIVGQ